MAEKLILQIGRLDSNYQKNIKFIFDSKEYNNPLSSLAFKEHFNNAAKVILLYPVSLVLNDSLKNKSDDNFIGNHIMPLFTDEELKNKYLQNPYDILKEHPHSKQVDDLFVIHSLGRYSNIDFKTTMHDIILCIWSLLIKEYINNNFQEIYIDISSGLNFYMASLLEALRYFLVWQQLYELKTKKVKGFINYTDPIIGASADKINIYTYKVDHKSFFSSPLDYINYEKNSKNVYEKALDRRELKKEVNPILKEFLILFSSLYRPAPLILFIKEFSKLETVEDKIIKTVNATLEKYKKDWIKSPEFEFEEFLKIFMALGFMRGLRKFMDENNINNSKGYATYNELEDMANNMKDLGLQVQAGLLKTELINNFKNKHFSSEWEYLKKFLQYEDSNKKDSNSSNQEIDPRNFFAHAGFERTVTLVNKEKENDTVCIKYDEKQMDRIIELLKEGIKGE